MLNIQVILIGVGGIGSWAASEIVRLGCPRLVMYDPDSVESHNRLNQNYEDADIGRPKVLATAYKLYGIASWHKDHGREIRIVPKQERVDGDTKLRGIVIVAVDTAPARKEIFSLCRYNKGVPLLIETGAAENRGVVRILDPSDKDQVEAYEKLLGAYGEEGEGPPPCVSPHMGKVFAGVIAQWLRLFSEGWRPVSIHQSRIDFRAEPLIDTEKRR